MARFVLVKADVFYVHGAANLFQDESLICMRRVTH
jgi:hypothetical protein